MKKKLNYEKMLKDICKLVETEFCMTMEVKESCSEKYTQKEAKKMSNILGKVYLIAHCSHCKACQRDYLVN